MLHMSDTSDTFTTLFKKKNVASDISQAKVFKLNGHAYLEINFSHMTFYLETTSQLPSMNFLKYLTTEATKLQFSHSSPPYPSLLFTTFYTCILFHASINPSLPCPHFSSNKRSCIKSMNQS
jgi:hypothetical protein